MLPVLGRSNPAISISIVVLPEPDGPSRGMNSPAGISRATPSTARCGPYSLAMPHSCTGAPGRAASALSTGAAASMLPCCEQKQVDVEDSLRLRMGLTAERAILLRFRAGCARRPGCDEAAE